MSWPLRVSCRSVLLLAACAAAGCGSARKREAGALIGAVDRCRRAGPAATAQQIEDLRRLACSDPDVCSARGVCADALDATVRAMALKDQVSVRLADIEGKRLAPTSDEARALPGKLDDATRLLGQGRAKMGTCDELLAGLGVKYGL